MEQKKTTTDEKDELGIVSVNTRTGTPGNTAGKLVFLVVVGSVLVIGLLMGMNQWRATRTAEAASEEQAAKVENKPAQDGRNGSSTRTRSISLAEAPPQLERAELTHRHSSLG